MSLLYNKVPDAYITLSSINTKSVISPKDVKSLIGKSKSKHRQRHMDFDEKNWKLISCFQDNRSLRIVNIGKTFVTFQIEALRFLKEINIYIESKNGNFGIERSSSIVNKHGKCFFIFKNKKIFLSKANHTI